MITRIASNIEANWKIIVLVMLFIFAWMMHAWTPAPEVGKTVKATPSVEVEGRKKIEVAIKSPVKVFSGGSQLKKLVDLPPEVVQNDHQQVIASSKIEAEDDHPHTITTVIDTETGESQTYVRTDPLPLIDWDDHGRIGLYYGYKNGTAATRLQAQQGLFRIKSVHVNMLASIDQSLNTPVTQAYFVGIGAEYRW